MPFLSDRVRREFLDSCARIKNGTLRLRTPEGDWLTFGDGAPEAVMEIHDWSAVTAAAARADVGLGEAYVAGLWDTPSIATLIGLALENYDEFDSFTDAGFWQTLKFRIADRILRPALVTVAQG